MKIQIFNYTISIDKTKEHIKDVLLTNQTIEYSEQLNFDGLGDKKMNEHYDVLDVARYIIDYCIRQGSPISQLQLQKILYYVQAAFLVNREQPCFEEEILNWEYGPVVREVFDEFRKYGSKEITQTPTVVRISMDKEFNMLIEEHDFDVNEIRRLDAQLINQITDIYRQSNAFSLVKKTHEEEPWRESIRNDVIQNQIIEDYYRNNQDILYGARVNG